MCIKRVEDTDNGLEVACCGISYPHVTFVVDLRHDVESGALVDDLRRSPLTERYGDVPTWPDLIHLFNRDSGFRSH